MLQYVPHDIGISECTDLVEMNKPSDYKNLLLNSGIVKVGCDGSGNFLSGSVESISFGTWNGVMLSSGEHENLHMSAMFIAHNKGSMR